VDVVAVHGDKDQEERTTAIAQFKAGSKDVLVATDVASKGLDFPGIQHVVNYDMPSQIEDYVHRWVVGWGACGDWWGVTCTADGWEHGGGGCC
jgi:ATP-dependent RNA helicase DDX41